MCEQIIRLFNKKMLPNCKEPLLVKFADYGNKKKAQPYRTRENSAWDRPDVSTSCLRLIAVLYFMFIMLFNFAVHGNIFIPKFGLE